MTNPTTEADTALEELRKDHLALMAVVHGQSKLIATQQENLKQLAQAVHNNTKAIGLIASTLPKEQ